MQHHSTIKLLVFAINKCLAPIDAQECCQYITLAFLCHVTLHEKKKTHFVSDPLYQWLISMISASVPCCTKDELEKRKREGNVCT